MIVSFIVAISENNVIGRNNQLIWHLPKDMALFKKITTGHYIITGRKNYESIPEKYRPLPNRTNIVITRQKDYKADKSIVVSSVEEALEYCRENDQEEVFVIGGGQIFKEVMGKHLVERMYVTHIHHHFEGDTFFPEINQKRWKKSESIFYKADEQNPYDFTFVIYEKV